MNNYKKLKEKLKAAEEQKDSEIQKFKGQFESAKLQVEKGELELRELKSSYQKQSEQLKEV